LLLVVTTTISGFTVTFISILLLLLGVKLHLRMRRDHRTDTSRR
jgi:hypothetical protein